MILAAAGVAAPCAGDVLFLKDGTRLSAKVKSCDEEVCVTDRRRIPTDQIARIELSAGQGAASTIKGSGAVMTDGTILAGRFTGLTLGYVSIGDEELERGDSRHRRRESEDAGGAAASRRARSSSSKDRHRGGESGRP